MKKVITLVLAIALVLTGVVAIAETVEAPAAPKGTPNINSFATMKVVYHGAKFNNRQNWNLDENYYEITLSKPVDRLLICWAEKGAEPEELTVGEDLKATALAWNHKYMPGTIQTVKAKPVAPDPTVAKDVIEKGWVEVKPSEWAYQTVKTTSEKRDGAVNYVETTIKDEKWELNDVYSDKDWEYIVAEYMNAYPDDEYDIVRPGYVTKEVEEKDKFGNVTIKSVPVTDDAGNKIFKPGYIQGISVKLEKNDKIDLPKAPVVQTVIATPAQTAFMTGQGEWALYYNRAGKIVGIEYLEGQF